MFKTSNTNIIRTAGEAAGKWWKEALWNDYYATSLAEFGEIIAEEVNQRFRNMPAQAQRGILLETGADGKPVDLLLTYARKANLEDVVLMSGIPLTQMAVWVNGVVVHGQTIWSRQ